MRVEIDGKKYVPEETHPHTEAMKLLYDIYRELWCEAFYYPTNEKLQKFAEPLARKMSEANSTLHFKG